MLMMVIGIGSRVWQLNVQEECGLQDTVDCQINKGIYMSEGS
jgi:hypothetical protein